MPSTVPWGRAGGGTPGAPRRQSRPARRRPLSIPRRAPCRRPPAPATARRRPRRRAPRRRVGVEWGWRAVFLQQLARGPSAEGYLSPSRAGRPSSTPTTSCPCVIKPAAPGRPASPELTFHDLRHTGASLMIAAGCHVRRSPRLAMAVLLVLKRAAETPTRGAQPAMWRSPSDNPYVFGGACDRAVGQAWGCTASGARPSPGLRGQKGPVCGPFHGGAEDWVGTRRPSGRK